MRWKGWEDFGDGPSNPSSPEPHAGVLTFKRRAENRSNPSKRAPTQSLIRSWPRQQSLNGTFGRVGTIVQLLEHFAPERYECNECRLPDAIIICR
jgi:hypothetical protein